MMSEAKSDSSAATHPALKQLTPVLIVDAVEISEQPGSAGELMGHSVALFITVADLDPVAKALEGAPVVKPRHETFYGSTEIYVREPGGNTVGFAQFS